MSLRMTTKLAIQQCVNFHPVNMATNPQECTISFCVLKTSLLHEIAKDQQQMFHLTGSKSDLLCPIPVLERSKVMMLKYRH